MTEIFDDPQTHEAASTLEDSIHDLQLIGRLIFSKPTEPDVPRVELKSLFNLPCIPLELSGLSPFSVLPGRNAQASSTCPWESDRG